MPLGWIGTMSFAKAVWALIGKPFSMAILSVLQCQYFRLSFVDIYWYLTHRYEKICSLPKGEIMMRKFISDSSPLPPDDFVANFQRYTVPTFKKPTPQPIDGSLPEDYFPRMWAWIGQLFYSLSEEELESLLEERPGEVRDHDINYVSWWFHCQLQCLICPQDRSLLNCSITYQLTEEHMKKWMIDFQAARVKREEFLFNVGVELSDIPWEMNAMDEADWRRLGNTHQGWWCCNERMESQYRRECRDYARCFPNESPGTLRTFIWHDDWPRFFKLDAECSAMWVQVYHLEQSKLTSSQLL